MSTKRRKAGPKPKPCKGCAHYRSSTGSRGGEEICHYIIDTGEPRGCPPASCDKRVEALPQRAELLALFDHDAYERGRARRCGDQERAVFARGRMIASGLGKTSFTTKCKTGRQSN